MAESFGHWLRDARRIAGISQAELGAGRYSGSYISHLESGRRKPTPDVQLFLAAQLGVPAHDLRNDEVDGMTASTAHDLTTQLVLLQVNARAASDHGQQHEVVAIAEQGRAAAGEEQPDMWWSFSFLEAQALQVLEDHVDCVSLCEELLAHALARNSPELRTEVHVIATRAERSAGHLESALHHADLAVKASQEISPEAPQRVHALLGQLSALAELGRLEEAVTVGDALRSVRDTVTSAHLKGQIAWSLGNLAFLSGDAENGLVEHDVAAKCLSPDSDLRLWGRFCKASAAMRLAAGRTDGAAALLDLAATAIDLVGNTGDQEELQLTRAELQFQVGDPITALATLEKVLAADADLPPHTRAEGDWLRYQCLSALGDPSARDAVREAALHYEEAGAFERAVHAWRTYSDVSERTT